MRLTAQVMLPILALILALSVLTAALLTGTGPGGVMQWAIAQQRAFQNLMAGAIRALRGGEAGAWITLLSAAGAYGFVHALGPGHGKFAIGGVGLGVGVGAGRLVGVALASSLAQAVWAIALVYGGFAIFEASAARLTTLTEDVLAPASYAMIGAIGVFLVWRGVLAARRAAVRQRAGHDHHPACGCGGHGPSPDQVARLSSWREGAALVIGIAARPCTGAVFLLVITWQMDLRLAGVSAVMVMGLGTACLTSLVAVSTVAARGLAVVPDGRDGRLTMVSSALQIAAGALIVWGSVSLL